jgi:hypothetical protein
MLGWLRRSPDKVSRLLGRVIEGMREVGILLIAFAPLDVALNPGSGRRALGVLLFFGGLGLLLFIGALALEWRQDS